MEGTEEIETIEMVEMRRDQLPNGKLLPGPTNERRESSIAVPISTLPINPSVSQKGNNAKSSNPKL